MKWQDGLAYREEGRADGPVALMLHGVPQSSYMWAPAMAAAAAEGWRTVAPDLPGFGDSPADPPGTWERQIEAVERFRRAVGIERVVLVVHDWGGLIGLRWACDHPDAVAGLVISSTGFFPDGKWHGMAKALRTEGTGEELMQNLTKEGLAAVLRQTSTAFDDGAVDECWKAYGDEERRRGLLELYRSGDFDKLAPYEGRLAALGVPCLLVWGRDDPFAPVAGAMRFDAELPDSRLVVIEEAGHFVWDEAPEESARVLGEFLHGLGP